jgi:hypothetical protein
MKTRTFRVLALAAALALPSALSAQQWDHVVTLYGWGTFVDGSAQYGRLESGSEVNVDPGQVIDSLELAAMARYRGQTERWAVVFDGIYASLGASKETPFTKLDLNMYVFQLDGAFRFTEHSEVLAGVRYVRFDTTLDVGRDALARHLAADASLWDPVVGLRTVLPLGDRWMLQAQGDVGGGANMTFTWQAMANVGWKLGDSSSLWAGYRALGMDFDDAGNRNKLSMDVTFHGPVIGAAFHI